MSDWVDPDDARMLTKEFFERAEIRVGGKVVREATGTLTRSFDKPGRPPVGEEAKAHVSLRLDRDVVEFFRSGGAGWQTRMNEALRKVSVKPAAVQWEEKLGKVVKQKNGPVKPTSSKWR